MLRKKILRVFAIALVLLMAVALLAGCAKDGTSDDQAKATTTAKADASKTTAAATKKKMVSLRWVVYADQTLEVSPVQEDFYKSLEEKFNVKLNIERWSKNTYKDKLNVLWASQEWPDIIEITEAADKIKQGMDNKLFASTLEIVKKSPYYKGIPYENLMYKGDLYKFPKKRMQGPMISIVVRKDWMEKLGIQDPKTPDELLDMAIAFAKKDPDGNGKDDTYGMTIIGEDLKFTGPYWQMFVPSFNYRTGPYYIENGKLKDSLYLAEDMKAALEWFNKAYNNGGLDPEFMVDKKKTSEAKFLTGKAGMWNKSYLFVPKRRAKVIAAFPNAKVDVLPNIKGKYGYNGVDTAKTPFDGDTFVIAKSKNVDRALEVLAFAQSTDGIKLKVLGVEGKHYVVKDNKIEWKVPNGEKFFNPGVLLNAGIKLPVPLDPQIARDYSRAKPNTRVIEDPRPYLVESKAYQERIGDLKKMYIEAIYGFIMNQKPISEYDDFLKNYREAGADQVIKEVNEILAKVK